MIISQKFIFLRSSDLNHGSINFILFFNIKFLINKKINSNNHLNNIQHVSLLFFFGEYM